jgi:hypothetical protein
MSITLAVPDAPNINNYVLHYQFRYYEPWDNQFCRRDFYVLVELQFGNLYTSKQLRFTRGCCHILVITLGWFRHSPERDTIPIIFSPLQGEFPKH